MDDSTKNPSCSKIFLPAKNQIVWQIPRVGVRTGLDGSIAYTTSFASAVEVTPKIGRVFVFSSKNPDRIYEIINQKKATQFIQVTSKNQCQ